MATKTSAAALAPELEAPPGDNGQDNTPKVPEEPTTIKTPQSFEVLTFEDIPDMDPSRVNFGPLPWKAKWDAMAPEVLADGKARGFYVPASFFIEERGVTGPEKVTHGYIKQKVGDEWKKWLDKDATRACTFALGKGNRTGKEQGYTDKGMGVLVILQKLKK